MPTIWSKIRRTLTGFCAARGGNVAITFAIASLPVIGGVGAAVDYSRAHAVKAALQTALDSTALMLSRDAATLSNGDLQIKALDIFKAVFTRPEAQNMTVTASYTTDGGSAVTVNASVAVPTNIMTIMGYDSITVGGSSTAKWGSNRLRVALSLDTTGSMASAGKMTALKEATKNLLTQLKAAASVNGDVYVSIIPFSKDVNVGSSNYNQNWIDWTTWENYNGTCSGGGWGWGWGGGWGSGTRSTCSGTWTPKAHSTWNGCVTDRGESSAPGSTAGYDQKVDAPDPNITASLFPAEQDSGCPAQMMGLNYNWTSMNSLVDQLYPNGMTNQPIGLVWAWQSLVGGGGLTVPAKDPNYTYNEIIILMSDGLNTRDRWYQSQTSIDNRMYNTGNGSGTCANIKAAGITIYTVHVNTDGDPLSTLLRNCASSTDKFWMITSANDLNSVFAKIGNDLSQLRVAK